MRITAALLTLFGVAAPAFGRVRRSASNPARIIMTTLPHRQGPRGSSTVTYEYDAFGNWTSRLVVRVMNSGAQPVEISELRRREFTYR